MCSYKAPVALFISEDKFMVMVLLKELDLLADVFESGERLDQIHIIFLRQSPGHLAGHDSCDYGTVFRQSSHGFSL